MPNKTVPSPYAAISARCAATPDALAVITPQHQVTYRQFCRDIETATRLLQALKLPTDSRVGVVTAGMYLHWVVTISLFRLGLLATSCAPASLPILKPTVVITDSGISHPGARAVNISREWLQSDAAGLPAFEDSLHEPDAPGRIVLSSGTTGVSKLALFTNQEFAERLSAVCADYAYTPQTREQCLMGVTSVGGIVWPLGCWMTGGTMLLSPLTPDKILAQFLRDKPTMMYASPAQLEALLSTLPPGFKRRDDLVMYVAGSVLSDALNRRTRERLTSNLVLVYGSTEIGTATLAPASDADGKPGLTGYAHPPVQIEIVDHEGQPVPAGELGEVRMRNLGQIHRYLDDEVETELTFRGGWFHPGDLGMLEANGALYIKGRVREVMNFGGLKVSPAAIDELLAGAPGVTDLAAFAAEANGRTRPAVAVVAGAQFDEAAEGKLRERCRQAMPSLPKLAIMRVASIPRNEMGKIQRVELSRQFAAKLA
ncbi:class I adenylate-forming enzyme family protein [Caenimonas sp. SL110]|uniref:class I adenylate-forming enzyme family protein n=1 Tax=Caenimonas sp. SL110 TaxID=1450524 RepID=UPI00065435FA|nr:fatty acid--CoA ligase family protein [Caenimonas sp. SL110]